MKILILGAGQVGSTLARYLCLDDDNDITIVDQKEEMLISSAKTFGYQNCYWLWSLSKRFRESRN